MKTSAYILLLLCLVSRILNADETVKTNAIDKRDFEYLVLENNLKVLLISDQYADKASVALDVGAGAGSDPLSRPGLAHFLEHMLFLGTEKYPDASDFHGFISQNGGEQNAYTAVNNTNYFFDVYADALEPALDRFAQFFISPKLDQKYVEREREAVNSEFISRLSDAHLREKDVLSQFFIPSHPIAKFTTGNQHTLAGDTEQLYSELSDFFTKFYHADNMALVIASSQPISYLRTLAKEKFSPIQQKKLQKKSFASPFKTDVLPAEVHVKSQKKGNKLSLFFPIRDTRPYVREKPIQYINHLLLDEGEGSLLSVLRRNKLADYLHAGQTVSWTSGGLYVIDVELGSDGIKNVALVRDVVFEYLDLIRRKGIRSWRFDEMAKLSKVAFENAEREYALRDVSLLSEDLQRIDVKNIYWNYYRWEKYNPQLIEQYLLELNPQNSFAMVSSPEVFAQQQSPHYKTPYKIANEKTSLFSNRTHDKALRKLKKQMALPRANPTAARSFTIYENSYAGAEKEKPKLIHNKNGLRAWYLNDNVFDLPKGTINIDCHLPKAIDSAQAAVAMSVYVSMLDQFHGPDLFKSSRFGLGYVGYASDRGLAMAFHGYNDKLPKPFKRVVKSMRELKNNKRLRRNFVRQFLSEVKKDIRSEYYNFKYEKVYAQAFSVMTSTIYHSYWSNNERQKAIEKVDEAFMLSFIEKMFQQVQCDMLVFGNFRMKDADKFVRPFAKLLSSSEKTETPIMQVLKLPEDKVLLANIGLENEENIVAIYYQGHKRDMNERALMLLAAKMIDTPLYHALRTEQQLGYLVFSMDLKTYNVPGFFVAVQSPNIRPEIIQQRIMGFFRQNEMNLMRQFDDAKKGLLKTLSVRPENQSMLANEFVKSISQRDFEFDDKHYLIDEIKKITAADFSAFYQKTFLGPGHKMIFAGSKNGKLGEELVEKATISNDFFNLKHRLPYYVFPELN